MAQSTAPGWHLKGDVVIACNCDYGCPCNFNAPPTHGNCQGGWTWYVEDGRHGDVDLSGLFISLYCIWPKAIHYGNGEAVAWVDERADERQRSVLAEFLRGEIGGPWAILKNTFTTFHDPVFVPYEGSIEDPRTTVRVGSLLELGTEPVKNPVTGVESFPRAILPQGFIVKEAALLRSSSLRLDGPIEYDHTGKYAAVGPFSYQQS
jgi:hypothetical protein